jgi:hypothetical protein
LGVLLLELVFGQGTVTLLLVMQFVDLGLRSSLHFNIRIKVMTFSIG